MPRLFVILQNQYNIIPCAWIGYPNNKNYMTRMISVCDLIFLFYSQYPKRYQKLKRGSQNKGFGNCFLLSDNFFFVIIFSKSTKCFVLSFTYMGQMCNFCIVGLGYLKTFSWGYICFFHSSKNISLFVLIWCGCYCIWQISSILRLINSCHFLFIACD